MAENKYVGDLQLLDTQTPHTFAIPSKRINEGENVSFWLTTWAYTDVMTFILQLNAAMLPEKSPDQRWQAWTLDASQITGSVTAGDNDNAVTKIGATIKQLDLLIDATPPDPGPRRFGNVSFRQWYQKVEDYLNEHITSCIPQSVQQFPSLGAVKPQDELKAYLLGSFGSPQRLDYGTGHELSFIAFLACLWKLGGFRSRADTYDAKGSRERDIVMNIIEPYLALIRKLILTYTLEPAGSHGVWGLDDHSFVSYIFGSAQLSPPISSPSEVPQEGSLPGAPRPSDVTKSAIVSEQRKKNMYFSAIGFIYDVKKGPFWEHSPMLFDISGVTAGWAKINKGMVKMYNAEVLSKFPVVQHFPFGSLLRWERNPSAPVPVVSTHTASQPQGRVSNIPPSSTPTIGRPGPPVGAGTAAPWASGPARRSNAMPGPTASWTGQSGAPGMPATRAPWASASSRGRTAGRGGGTSS